MKVIESNKKALFLRDESATINGLTPKGHIWTFSVLMKNTIAESGHVIEGIVIIFNYLINNLFMINKQINNDTQVNKLHGFQNYPLIVKLSRRLLNLQAFKPDLKSSKSITSKNYIEI